MISFITSFCSALCNSRFIGENKKETEEEKQRKKRIHSNDTGCQKCFIYGIQNVSATLQMKNNTVLLLLGDLLVFVYWEMFILCMDRKYKYKSDSISKRRRTKRKNQRKILNLYDFVHVLLSCYSLQRAPSRI